MTPLSPHRGMQTVQNSTATSFFPNRSNGFAGTGLSTISNSLRQSYQRSPRYSVANKPDTFNPRQKLLGRSMQAAKKDFTQAA